MGRASEEKKMLQTDTAPPKTHLTSVPWDYFNMISTHQKNPAAFLHVTHKKKNFIAKRKDLQAPTSLFCIHFEYETK